MAKSPRENRIPIMMSHDELAAIDDWRFANRIATRSDAVRRLCQIALATIPIAADGAMDQADQLLELVQATVDDQVKLGQEIREGKYADTATPENVLSDSISDLLEIADNVYWLHSQLLQVNLITAELSKGSIASAKRANRITAEKLEADRTELEAQRRQYFENMLLSIVSNHLSNEERAELDAMDEEKAEAFLTERVQRLKARTKALGIGIGEKLYNSARGLPDPRLQVAILGEYGDSDE